MTRSRRALRLAALVLLTGGCRAPTSRQGSAVRNPEPAAAKAPGSLRLLACPQVPESTDPTAQADSAPKDALGPTGSAAGHDCAAPPSGRPQFVLGVWYQPSSSFAKWKERGVNTMVGYETEGGARPIRVWRQELDSLNLYAIRQPDVDTTADAKDPRLLAWFVVRDEPDVAFREGEQGTDPASVQRGRDRLRIAAPDMPLFINLSGGYVIEAFQGIGRPSLADYQAYLQSADWISQDHYPITGRARPDWIDLRLPIARRGERPNRFTVGWLVSALRTWSGGKPQFAILETSNANVTWVPPKARRGVTAAELRGQIWHAIIHGAHGLVYFPCSFNPFQYDATPADVSAEMKVQNKRITAWADILLSPGDVVPAPVPFEAATRLHDGHRYRLVLNFSHDSATYENGNRYGPYDYHIYEDGHS